MTSKKAAKQTFEELLAQAVATLDDSLERPLPEDLKRYMGKDIRQYKDLVPSLKAEERHLVSLYTVDSVLFEYLHELGFSLDAEDRSLVRDLFTRMVYFEERRPAVTISLVHDFSSHDPLELQRRGKAKGVHWISRVLLVVMGAGLLGLVNYQVAELNHPYVTAMVSTETMLLITILANYLKRGKEDRLRFDPVEGAILAILQQGSYTIDEISARIRIQKRDIGPRVKLLVQKEAVERKGKKGRAIIWGIKR